MDMDIKEAILNRRSIRGFKPDPVPRNIIEDILEISTRTPSGKNAQPWEFVVLTGDVLGRIAAGNVACLMDGTPENPDVPIPPPTGIYKERNIQTAKQLYGTMGIAREDKDARVAWWQRGFRYFDASAVVLLLTDREVPLAKGQRDVGMITQTIILLAQEYGLGTCVVSQGVIYTDVIRKHTGISPDKLITIAIALGYPDPDFPANHFVSGRVPAAEITTWYGFNEEG
jgi:nitroreductase